MGLIIAPVSLQVFNIRKCELYPMMIKRLSRLSYRIAQYDSLVLIIASSGRRPWANSQKVVLICLFYHSGVSCIYHLLAWEMKTQDVH